MRRHVQAVGRSARHRGIAAAVPGALALLLCGCPSFTAGVEEPDLRAEASDVRTRIVVGESRREQVHGLLGPPIYADDRAGVELFASESTDASTDWLVVGIVPVPGWTQVRHYRLYPVVVYDVDGTVRGVDAGYYAEHYAKDQPLKQPDSRSAEIAGYSLEVDPCPDASCLWLVAPAEASARTLRQPPAPGECVIDLARPPPGTRIELDGKVLLENIGAGADASPAAPVLPWFAHVAVPAGTHLWRATPTANALIATGEVTRHLDCHAGEIVVLRFHRILGPSDDVLGRIQLRGEFETAGVESLPDDARAILYAGGRPFATP